jgi:release factor glutamine methyltransferase
VSDARTLLNEAAARLSEAGIESARRDARILLAYAMGISPDTLATSNTEVRNENLFLQLIGRRVAREPVAYITGEREFWSLSFAVGPGALIPRPETELLIEQLLAAFPKEAELDILDLGTGSGCLIIAALTEFPRAYGTAVDSSPAALRWAKQNAESLGVLNRLDFKQADWLDEGQFDVILSNPPYIPSADIAGLMPDVARYEPMSALDGGPDGLDAYRALAPRAATLLKPGGWLFWEFGAGQEDAVSGLLAQAGLKIIKIAPDLAGIPRCVAARRTT